MQWPGIGATRTKIPPSKQEREITKIANCQNTKKTSDVRKHLSKQLFPKRWPVSNLNRTKHNMNKHKVKRHRNSRPSGVFLFPDVSLSGLIIFHDHMLCLVLHPGSVDVGH